jgi:hypothetical protein
LDPSRSKVASGIDITSGVSIVIEELAPGQGWSQRVRPAEMVAVTVTDRGEDPVSSRVTSLPVVDDSDPLVVFHVNVGLSTPVAVARNVGRSLASTLMSQVTFEHGASVTSNVAAQVVCPVVTQSPEQSAAVAVAVTEVIT